MKSFQRHVQSVRHRVPGKIAEAPERQEHQPGKEERGKRHNEINHLALGNQMHEVAGHQRSFANGDKQGDPDVHRAIAEWNVGRSNRD